MNSVISFEFFKSGSYRLIGFAVMLLPVRLKWGKTDVIGLFGSEGKIRSSWSFVCNVDVVPKSFVWCW